MRKRIFLLLLPLCLISCGGVSQDDYDSLMYKYNQLEKEANDYKSKLSSCEDELDKYKERCEDLSNQVDNTPTETYTKVVESNGSEAASELYLIKRELQTLASDINNGYIDDKNTIISRLVNLYEN